MTAWLIARGARGFLRGLTALAAGWATAIIAGIIAIVAFRGNTAGYDWRDLLVGCFVGPFLGLIAGKWNAPK
jgi:membrane-bound metal-dependent hydrolase YbcI (DUF457 family)